MTGYPATYSTGFVPQSLPDAMAESGRCRAEFHLGDCIEVMAGLPDDSIDMIFCDLPYGVTQNWWDSMIPLDDLWQQYDRLLKPGAPAVLTAGFPFDKMLAMSNAGNLRIEWVWRKNKATGHLNASHRPLMAHEHVLVFCGRKPKAFNPIRTGNHAPQSSVPRIRSATMNEPDRIGGNYGLYERVSTTGGQTDRHPVSVIEIPVHDNISGDKFHPTQKPVALAEYFIQTYSNSGDTVLDSCFGSNSTGMACRSLSRNYVGIERDDIYYEYGIRRFEGLSVDRGEVTRRIERRAESGN